MQFIKTKQTEVTSVNNTLPNNSISPGDTCVEGTSRP